jgi:hypothetical protein
LKDGFSRIRASARSGGAFRNSEKRSHHAISFIRTVTVGPGIAPGLLTPAA